MFESMAQAIEGNYSLLEYKLNYELDNKRKRYDEPSDAAIEFAMRFVELLKKNLDDALSDEVGPIKNLSNDAKKRIRDNFRNTLVAIKDDLRLADFDEFESVKVTTDSTSEAKRYAAKTLSAAVKERLRIINSFIKSLLPVFLSKEEAALPSNVDYSDVDYWVTHLAEKYDVPIEIIDTNDKFEDDETIKRSEQEGVYFISREDPQGTLRITHHLLKRRAIRNELLVHDPQMSVKTELDFKDRNRALIDLANKKRLDQSLKTANEANNIITTIVDEYRQQHDGQEPKMAKIAEILTQKHIPTPGKARTWYAETVRRVLEKAVPVEDAKSHQRIIG